MSREDDIKKIFYTYEEAGLIEGNSAKVLSLLSDDVIGIGLGDQGFVSSKKEIQHIMTNTLKQDASAHYELSYKNVIVRFTGAANASLCAQVIVHCTKDDATTVSSFMQSLNFTLVDGVWYICHLHASPYTVSEESVAAYPMTFFDKSLSYMRSHITTEAFDLMSANFVGGVVGVHKVGNKYPLHFANDGIARFLGYTVEEFHEIFKEDVSQIFYKGDYERAMMLTEDIVVRNMDVSARLRLQKKDGACCPSLTTPARRKTALATIF